MKHFSQQESSMILKAQNIARQVHANQFRKDGTTPYMVHVNAVVDGIHEAHRSAETVMVAFLHDCLEDGNQEEVRKMIEDAGFPKEVIEAVELLTKKNGQTYMEYICGISANEIAREVKISDIQHNLGCNPKQETISKYIDSLKVLYMSRFEAQNNLWQIIKSSI